MGCGCKNKQTQEQQAKVAQVQQQTESVQNAVKKLLKSFTRTNFSNSLC